MITPGRVILNLRVRDKGALLDELARRVDAPGLAPDAIAAALKGREELGSTGLGRGFALPHARLPDLRIFIGLLARLARPIDYAAIDGEPVDLVFLLLIPQQESTVPESAAVSTLAAIARRFRDEDTLAKVRAAATAAEIHSLMTAA
jgi:PTS system nitrogen regulatory IIA component